MQRDEHLLQHFPHESCSDCNQNLIRIGNCLYIIHTAITCIKCKFEVEEHTETCIADEIAVENENGAEMITDADVHQILDGSADYDTICLDEIQIKLEPDDEAVEDFEMQNPEYSGEKMVKMREKPANCPAACDICGQMFKYKKSIRRHKIRAHSAPGTKFCAYCTKLFATWEELFEHKKKLCRNKNGKEPAQKSAVDELSGKDKERALNNPFACDVCGQIFKNKRSIGKHKIRAHSAPGTKLCSYCIKVFPTWEHLFKHKKSCRNKNGKELNKKAAEGIEIQQEPQYFVVETSEKDEDLALTNPFKCNICGKVLKNKRLLEKHKLRHYMELGTKNCVLCLGKFRYEDEYLRHRCFTKETVKPKCPYCQVEFPCSEDLQNHLPVCLSRKKAKSRMCNICGKILCSNYALQAHINSHTGEKPIKCSHEGCSKTFRHESSRIEHMRMHTGEKPFHCTIDGCDQRYAYRVDFNRHKFKVHGIYTRKYPCQICTEIFPEKHILTKHMEKSHLNLENSTH